MMKFVELDRDDVFDNHENIFVIFDNQEYEVIFTQREAQAPAEAVAEVDWPHRPFRYTHKMYAVPVRPGAAEGERLAWGVNDPGNPLGRLKRQGRRQSFC